MMKRYIFIPHSAGKEKKMTNSEKKEMTVAELPYKRVTKEEAEGYFNTFLQEAEKAKSADEVIAARNALLEGIKKYLTASSLAYCRFTLNTADEFYKGEMDYYDEINPHVTAFQNKYYRYMLSSPFRAELEEKLGALLFKTYEVAVKAHSDEVIPDEQEENAVVTEYAQLMSGMQFDWDGKKIPLSVLRGKLEDKDRAVRKAAAEAIGRGLEAHAEELDGIYDRLVKIRDRIAKKMGYRDFTELGYYRMGRTGYNREMVEAFRANVAADIVPAVTKLKENAARELGIDRVMFYDNDVYTSEGNPTFDLTPDEAFAAAKEMYHEMDPEIGAFMDFMLRTQAFDVVAREGKWGGGYCTEFIGYDQQFILANFNGTTGDADVLTHEFGHAYAMHASEEAGVDIELGIGGMETAECHSMSMEFLCWPYMEKFFKEGAGAYRYKHLADSFSFIPYGCIVDEFQHIVYEHPEYTPAQRNEAYLALEKKYRPHLSYEGIPYLEKGTRWQFQMHIYETPFYYIDYCLAQTVALGFLLKSRENARDALEKYKQFAKAGGSLPFSELVKRAEIPYPFGKGTLKKLAEGIEKTLATIR